MTNRQLNAFTATTVCALLFLVGCGAGSSMSIQDVRKQFVDAGGICTVETVTTPTTDPTSTSGSLSTTGKESINCGDEQSLITAYESAEDARKAAFFLDALKSGFLIAAVGKPSDSDTLVLDKYMVMLVSKSGEEIDTSGIAEAMNAVVVSGTDTSIRKEIFTELIEPTENGGIPLVSEACLSKELISSDKKSISFDSKGEEDSSGDSIPTAFCVLRALMAPDYVFTSIQETRALDGQVEEEWGNYRATWRYHPDSGLQMTVLSTI